MENSFFFMTYLSLGRGYELNTLLASFIYLVSYIHTIALVATC